MEEHPRGKKTSKRERELKAVIGLQEITIRNLINSLQEKANSAKDLSQTVKLAQAFSSARADTRDYGSDAEETLDEVSNSDVTSEYEFSLTKPQVRTSRWYWLFAHRGRQHVLLTYCSLAPGRISGGRCGHCS